MPISIQKTQRKGSDGQVLYMIRSLNSRDKKIAQTAIQAMLDNQ